MNKFVVLLAVGVFAVGAESQTNAVARPRILGIDHVSFYTTQPEEVKKLYGGTLGLAVAPPVEAGGFVRYIIGRQWVGYSAAPDSKAADRMDHVALSTDNIASLRKYLIANGLKVPAIEGRADHSLGFTVNDPEGHRIEFVERGKSETPAASSDSTVSRHVIHAGLLVHNRELEDRFYRERVSLQPPV